MMAYRRQYVLTALVLLMAFAVPVVRGEAPAEPRPTTTAVVDAPRSTAHTTLNDFMELYRKGDAESTQRMVEYLDQSGLKDDARANIATLAQRLAQFIGDNKIASKQFEALKLEQDEIDKRGEYCLYETAAAESKAGADDKKECRIRLVRQPGGDGLWQFDSQTVAGISLMAARAEPKSQKSESKEPSAEAKTPTNSAEVPAPQKVWEEFKSPQATMRTFLESMQVADTDKYDVALAASCLNLETWNLRETDRQAKLLATGLKFVLDRSVYVQLLELPDDPNIQSPSFYRTIGDRWNIDFERVADGRWLFSTKTLDSLRDMCRYVADTPPRVPNAPELSFGAMPELWLFLTVPKPALRSVGGLEIWQWIGLLLVFLTGILADRVARIILRRISGVIVRRLNAETDTKLEASALRPIGYVILGYIWLEFFQWLWLPKLLASILTNAAWFIVIVAGVWATYRVIDVVTGYLTILASRRASKFDTLLAPFLRKILKVVVTIAGLIYFASRLFPDNIGALLGSLGIGGLAFALAAQDTIKNLFGSITVMIDRPFEIGDWVKIDDVEGTVESVGFRSTRIRTFYNSQINVPNGMLIDAVVDNLGRRQFRRISCKLGLTYDTPPEKIDAFCEGVRELIRRHPYTRKDYYHVYFNEFGPSSLNVLLYCFHEAPDWSTELRERHRLFGDILRLAQRLGVEFAFPTQTLHLHDADKAPLGEPPPSRAGQLAPDIIGRSEAAAIAKVTVPPPDSLSAVEIKPHPQPVDDDYVSERLGGSGRG